MLKCKMVVFQIFMFMFIFLTIFTANNSLFANDITWKQRWAPGGQGFPFVMVVPSPETIIFAGVNFGSGSLPLPSAVVYRSINSGRNFAEVEMGEMGLNSFGSPVDMHFYNTTNGWLLTSSNIFVTSDGGANWSTQSRTSFPEDVTKVWHFNESKMVYVGGGGIIGWTENGGTSWTSVTPLVDANLEFISFINNNLGYICGVKKHMEENYETEEEEEVIDEGYVLKTTDGGKSWSILMSKAGHYITSATFYNENRGFVIGGLHEENLKLFRTTDGGQNFEEKEIQFDSGGRFDTLRILAGTTFFNENTFAAAGSLDTHMSSGGMGGGGNIYKTAYLYTDDFGDTWTSGFNPRGEFPNVADEGIITVAKFFTPTSAYAGATNFRFYSLSGCTSDNECGEGMRCVNGLCEAAPENSHNNGNNGSGQNNTAPSRCNDNEDCYGGYECYNNECRNPAAECWDDIDCASGEICFQDNCVSSSEGNIGNNNNNNNGSSGNNSSSNGQTNNSSGSNLSTNSSGTGNSSTNGNTNGSDLNSSNQNEGTIDDNAESSGCNCSSL